MPCSAYCACAAWTMSQWDHWLSTLHSHLHKQGFSISYTSQSKQSFRQRSHSKRHRSNQHDVRCCSQTVKRQGRHCRPQLRLSCVRQQQAHGQSTRPGGNNAASLCLPLHQSINDFLAARWAVIFPLVWGCAEACSVAPGNLICCCACCFCLCQGQTTAS